MARDATQNRSKEKMTLEQRIRRTMRSWVRENFGKSELEDPSWNIELLSTEIAGAVEKRTSGDKEYIFGAIAKVKGINDKRAHGSQGNEIDDLLCDLMMKIDKGELL